MFLLWLGAPLAATDALSSAEALWRAGAGQLWFQHMRRAGGTMMCREMLNHIDDIDWARGRSHVREDLERWGCLNPWWEMQNILSFVGGAPAISEVLNVNGSFNSVAQEYGPLPAVYDAEYADWVFVTSLRNPWARLLSQVQHEMWPCCTSVQVFQQCVRGQHREVWWAADNHPDTILGIPPHRISDTPSVFFDNYYTRVLSGKTWAENVGPEDVKTALLALRRVSVILVLEEVALTHWQFVCSLGIRILKSPKRHNTWSAHQGTEHSETVKKVCGIVSEASRSEFAQRNVLDEQVYTAGRALAIERVAACAREPPSHLTAWEVQEMREVVVPELELLRKAIQHV
mmetsp:Transcript_47068/g.102355  ORF Transcript_47068/g.102355 Transcript_47068/m.102355 type:complete len:345 (+) Transcript_47068:3-1037(+)